MDIWKSSHRLVHTSVRQRSHSRWCPLDLYWYHLANQREKLSFPYFRVIFSILIDVAPANISQRAALRTVGKNQHQVNHSCIYVRPMRLTSMFSQHSKAGSLFQILKVGESSRHHALEGKHLLWLTLPQLLEPYLSSHLPHPVYKALPYALPFWFWISVSGWNKADTVTLLYG